METLYTITVFSTILIVTVMMKALIRQTQRADAAEDRLRAIIAGDDKIIASAAVNEVM